MDEYTTEQGELLLWVQHLLIAEGEAAGHPEPEPSRTGQPVSTAPHPSGEAGAPPPVSATAQGQHAYPAERPRRIGDAVLDEAWPSPEDTGYCVVTVEPEPVEPSSSSSAGDNTDTMIKALVDVAPALLRRRDRIHRTGQGRVTLVLAKTNESGAALVVSRLEQRLGQELSSRGLSPVRLNWAISDSRSRPAEGREGFAAGAGG